MFPALRVIAVLHALSLFLQPILAGLFLSGQDTVIDIHAMNASAVVTLSLVQAVLTVLVARRGLLTGRLAGHAAGLFVLEIVQMGAGYAHTMWLHIPLGTMLLAGTATYMMRVMPGPRAAAVVTPAGAEAAE